MDKPEGWSTHSLSSGQRGLVELYSSQFHMPLLAPHKLDKTTSGALVFAKTREAAEHLRTCFHEHRVKTCYHFITDRQSSQAEFSGRTQMTRIKRSPFFELWQSSSSTSDCEQVRLHAQEVGIPILGDESHGGSSFPRLCLHLRDLEIPDFPTWTCPTPRLFERLGLLKDKELVRILGAIDQRQRLFSFLTNPETTLRLLDFDQDELALDLLGPTLWLHWYRDSDPTPRDLERWTLVAWLLHRPLVLQKRVNRGTQLSPATRWEIGPVKDQWIAVEQNQQLKVHYQFKRNQGESFGLFLDQRSNRSRLSEVAKGKTLLNLFAYTGGFSVVAALSGAAATTTVDLSAATIDWAKENFQLNQIPRESHEFFAADCFFFLDRALKKGRTWDLIVCDPPIFSRNKDQVFRIEKDFGKLLQLCEKALNPGGRLLFSTHYSGWDQNSLRKEIKKVFPGLVLDGQTECDFSQAHPLKSFWLQKLPS